MEVSYGTKAYSQRVISIYIFCSFGLLCLLRNHYILDRRHLQLNDEI